MSNLFDYILIGLSLYVLVSAIVGKGRLFEVGKVKEGKEKEFKKKLRLLYILLGIAMLINSGISFAQQMFYQYNAELGAYETVRDPGFLAFLTPSLCRTLSIVFLAIVLGFVVLLIIVTKKYTIKGATTQGSSESSEQNSHAARQAGHSLPIDAFEFDADGNIIDDDPVEQSAEPEAAEAKPEETAEEPKKEKKKLFNFGKKVEP